MQTFVITLTFSFQIIIRHIKLSSDKLKRPSSQLDKTRTSVITTSKSKLSGETGREKSSTATTTKPTAQAKDTTTTEASSKLGTKQDKKAKPGPPQDRHTDASTLTASEDRGSVEEIPPGNSENRKQKDATGDTKKTTEEKKEEKLVPVGKETVCIVKKLESVVVFM